MKWYFLMVFFVLVWNKVMPQEDNKNDIGPDFEVIPPDSVMGLNNRDDDATAYYGSHVLEKRDGAGIDKIIRLR